MCTYKVLVTIQNKPEISDPEGSTILTDLVLRSGTDDITEIRCSKGLRFSVSAESSQVAMEKVKQICDELRIYNPLVSIAEFSMV